MTCQHALRAERRRVRSSVMLHVRQSHIAIQVISSVYLHEGSDTCGSTTVITRLPQKLRILPESSGVSDEIVLMILEARKGTSCCAFGPPISAAVPGVDEHRGY